MGQNVVICDLEGGSKAFTIANLPSDVLDSLEKLLAGLNQGRRCRLALCVEEVAPVETVSVTNINSTASTTNNNNLKTQLTHVLGINSNN